MQFCQEREIKLLPYGTLCGGLLSETYLGKPEPSGGMLNTTSLKKYKNMLNMWGSWSLFQELLKTLKNIGDRHHVSISNIAVRYILDQPTVAGAIVGARLGLSEHLEENAQVFSVMLDTTDMLEIDDVLKKSQDLFKIIGDCGDEYRR
ncbi:hypothetical protein BCD67_21925 [Oscillatoriales cyanobacterium USR001]|nr:hypothetical protein BCD67_21925 [Oscillatoriales cyanobacterium USR001]